MARPLSLVALAVLAGGALFRLRSRTRGGARPRRDGGGGGAPWTVRDASCRSDRSCVAHHKKTPKYKKGRWHTAPFSTFRSTISSPRGKARAYMNQLTG